MTTRVRQTREQLLRAIVTSCTNLANESGCDLHSVAAAVEIEADALECRAIERAR